MRQAVIVGDAIVSAKQQGDSLILSGCQIGTCIGKVQHNQIIGILTGKKTWWNSSWISSAPNIRMKSCV